MHGPVEYLHSVCSREDGKIPQNTQTYNTVCEIAFSLLGIVKNPSCSFEKRKCTLFNFIEGFKTFLSCEAPYRISLTKDTNGFEYFLFIGTIGVYSIDLMLYKDVHGWVLLTDGSCVRAPAVDSQKDSQYTVSVRKSTCIPSSHCTIDCGDCILVYYYDACKDMCKIAKYEASQAEVKITSLSKKHKRRTLSFDICVECNGTYLHEDFDLLHLPCGYSVKVYQDDKEVGTASSFQTFDLDLAKDSVVTLLLVNECGNVVSKDTAQVDC